MRFLNPLFIVALIFACSAVNSTESSPAEKEKADKPIPEAMNFVSRDMIKIDGRAIEYTATAGTLLMKDKDDKPIALFGYTAYIKEGGERSGFYQCRAFRACQK